MIELFHKNKVKEWQWILWWSKHESFQMKNRANDKNNSDNWDELNFIQATIKWLWKVWKVQQSSKNINIFSTEMQSNYLVRVCIETLMIWNLSETKLINTKAPHYKHWMMKMTIYSKKRETINCHWFFCIAQVNWHWSFTMIWIGICKYNIQYNHRHEHYNVLRGKENEISFGKLTLNRILHELTLIVCIKLNKIKKKLH